MDIDKGEGSAGRKDAKKMTMSSRWNRKEAGRGPLPFELICCCFVCSLSHSPFPFSIPLKCLMAKCVNYVERLLGRIIIVHFQWVYLPADLPYPISPTYCCLGVSSNGIARFVCHIQGQSNIIVCTFFSCATCFL